MAQKKPQKPQSTPRARDAKGRFISAKVVAPVKVSRTKKAVAPIQPERQKNEAKVRAGKIRQATAIKDERGRFASKLFVNEVKKTILAINKIDVSKINSDQSEKIEQLLKEAKIKPADVAKFYKKNPLAFEDLKTKAVFRGTSKNNNQIETAIEKYKGKFFLRNEKGELKEVTKAQAKYNLVRFENALKSEFNLAGFSIHPRLTLDGKMILKIPSPTKLLKDAREKLGLKKGESFDGIDSATLNETLQELLNEYYDDENDIDLYIS